MAERRADARHAADALPRRTRQRVGDAQGEQTDKRQRQNHGSDDALHRILLFILLLFFIVHPIGFKRCVRAGEIFDAPVVSIHVRILSRRSSVGRAAQNPLFHFWRPHSPARLLVLGFWGAKIPKPKGFWHFGFWRRLFLVLGFSSTSPQVINNVFHSFTDFVDNLWRTVDNPQIILIFPILTGFFLFSQKRLISASVRLFPPDIPRPASRQPDPRDLCR